MDVGFPRYQLLHPTTVNLALHPLLSPVARLLARFHYSVNNPVSHAAAFRLINWAWLFAYDAFLSRHSSCASYLLKGHPTHHALVPTRILLIPSPRSPPVISLAPMASGVHFQFDKQSSANDNRKNAQKIPYSEQNKCKHHVSYNGE